MSKLARSVRALLSAFALASMALAPASIRATLKRSVSSGAMVLHRQMAAWLAPDGRLAVYAYPLEYCLREIAGFVAGAGALPVSGPWNRITATKSRSSWPSLNAA